MSTTPQPINTSISTSPTTLYQAFVGAVTRAMLISMDITNIMSQDIQISVWWESADGLTKVYFSPLNMNVPALGTRSYRGALTLSNASEKIRAQSNVSGTYAIGTVMES